MQLTNFTDYGMRALMRMAATPDQVLSVAEIADEFGISRNHLAKCMGVLSRAGFITTRRGGGGGALLARPADQIRLGDVVLVLSEQVPLVECFRPDGGNCSLCNSCALRVRLAAARHAFLAKLNESTLADIALTPRRPALRIPQHEEA